MEGSSHRILKHLALVNLQGPHSTLKNTVDVAAFGQRKHISRSRLLASLHLHHNLELTQSR